MKFRNSSLLAIVVMLASSWSCAAFAGGGGERMLMIVNPNDENAVRIAAAYQKARAIPDNNILFIAPPTSYGYGSIYLSQTELTNTYITPITQALAQRGLTDQIDYIGVLGQPERYWSKAVNTGDNSNSLTYALSLLTPLSQGLPIDNAVLTQTGVSRQNPWNIPIDSNPAIHHTQTYSVLYRNETVSRSSQYYMGGAIGYTGIQGNTPAQVISGFQRSAAADGRKPVGTVYFEENDDIRSNTREYEWGYTQAQLTARGVNWFQERLVPGATPRNRTDVRGAVIGMYTLTLPNGSTYLPGSWADNLTSYGAYWENNNQTKITEFIAAGAAATCGSVVEPYSIASRFTNSSVQTYVADGSTLGEAFFKSVQTPDIQLFLGDLLAQPYADVPTTTILSGPSEGAVVSGTVTLGARAALIGPRIATGIRRLDLFVDGKPRSTLTGDTGTFALDTTGLADGVHELRVVAVNNAQAESQGYLLRNVVVNNHNRSVATEGGDLSIDPRQVLPVAVNAAAGDGTVSRVELRSMGRSLGQVAGAAGNVSLDASKLAYGDNRVVPVAVYADGTEVAGQAINVHRNTPWKVGQNPTPTALRTPGFKGEFFAGQGQATIAASTFNGTPSAVSSFSKLYMNSGRVDSGGTLCSNLRGTNYWSPALTMPALNLDHLSARFTASFEIAPGKEGEYQFFFYRCNDSVQLSVDREVIQGFNGARDGYTPLQGADVFLYAGQHDLEVLASNLVTADAYANYFDLGLLYRGPDGITRVADSTFFYQTPEPSTCVLLICASIAVLRRRRRA